MLMWLLMACDTVDVHHLEDRVNYLEWQAEQEIEARDAEIAQLQTEVFDLQTAVADGEARIAELEPLVEDVEQLLNDAVGASEVYTHVCTGEKSYSHTWESVTLDPDALVHATIWYRWDDVYFATNGNSNLSPWETTGGAALLDDEVFYVNCSWFKSEDFIGFRIAEYALIID